MSHNTKTYWYRVAATAVILSICLFPAGLAFGNQNSTATSPSNQGSITVVHSIDYRPLFYVGDDGVSRGLLVDYWKLWSEKTGIAVSFQAIPWHECIRQVRSGQADIIPGIFYTAERDAFLDFSQSFMEVRTCVYSSKSSGIRQLSDLVDREVGVTQGDRAEDYLSKHISNARLKSYEGFQALVEAASRGEIAAFAMDAPSAEYYLHRYDAEEDFQRVATLYVGKFCAAVREGQADLLVELNRGIELIHEEEIQDLMEHWTPQDHLLPPAVLKWMLIGAIIGVVGFVLIHIIILRIRIHERTCKLAAAEARYQQLIDNAYEGVGVNVNGRYAFVSPSMIRITGYPAQMLRQIKISDLIHKDDLDSYLAREDQVKKGKEIHATFPIRIVTDIGEIKWVQISSVRIEWENQPALLEFMTDISDMKSAEKELTRERNFVSAVLQTAGALVMVMDREGRIVRFNRACETTSGYSFDEVKGKKAFDMFVLDDERETVESWFERILAGEFPSGGETCWKTRSDEHRRIAWSNTALCDPDGKVEFVVATGIDITEQKKAEEKLVLYRQLFDAAEDGIGVFNPQGRLVDRNPANRRLTGYSDEEIMGTRGMPWLSPEQQRTIEKELLATGHFHGGITGVHKDGHERYMDLSLFTIKNESGEILYYAGIARDMTERKEAEEALRYSEKRFRSLVENVRDIIFSISKDGKFAYLSPRVTELMGYEADELLGESLLPLLRPEMVDEFKAWIEAGMPAMDEEADRPFEMRHKDGQWHWYLSNASIVRDDSGDVSELIGAIHDVTDMKKALEDLEKANLELRQTQSQLVQSAKMASLGNLVAGIAHEINTPIGAVGSMHDTLTRAMDKLGGMLHGQLPPDFAQREEIEKMVDIIDEANRVIKSGTERVTTIVRRLRSFARLDEADLKTVDIHEGLEDTLMLIHHEIKNRLKVVRHYADLPPIACYPGRLNQVFLNILNNARHAISGKGTITVSTFDKGDRIGVSIADDGVGMPKETLKRIFDPGFTTKGVGVGTGLGLSICYQIVQNHQGHISATSQPGEGAKFTILLPKDLDRRTENRSEKMD